MSLLWVKNISRSNAVSGPQFDFSTRLADLRRPSGVRRLIAFQCCFSFHYFLRSEPNFWLGQMLLVKTSIKINKHLNFQQPSRRCGWPFKVFLFAKPAHRFLFSLVRWKLLSKFVPNQLGSGLKNLLGRQKDIFFSISTETFSPSPQQSNYIPFWWSKVLIQVKLQLRPNCGASQMETSMEE